MSETLSKTNAEVIGDENKIENKTNDTHVEMFSFKEIIYLQNLYRFQLNCDKKIT